jgi:glycine/D-amino acid oxidase-like deaminating enzyme
VWWATIPTTPAVRPSLRGDLDVDVAIVGAGYTGLWTALALHDRSPALRIAVLEDEVAGFGASGRNGGWASALYPRSFEEVASGHGIESARHLRDALRRGVGELGAAARAERIECDFERGGTVTLARSLPQVRRLHDELDAARQHGDGPEDLEWLEPDEARERCNATGVLGALYTPHCAAVHPAKLAVGLAAAVERRGISIYEHTHVSRIEPASGGARASAVTAAGVVRADVVVRATEGFTPLLRPSRREVVPLYSLVVATEPLPPEFFARVGLGDRETFTDRRHLIIYGQRTADDRLVFGGRGAPYHFGSRVAPRFAWLVVEPGGDPRATRVREARVDALRAVRRASRRHHAPVGRSARHGPGPFALRPRRPRVGARERGRVRRRRRRHELRRREDARLAPHRRHRRRTAPVRRPPLA